MRMCLVIAVSILALLTTSCERSPELHLHDGGESDIDLPFVDLDLDVVWDYELDYDIDYDWQAEWYYKWDAYDTEIFGGEIGYREPEAFNIRCYHTGQTAYGPHTNVTAHKIYTKTLHARFDWGFWDLLAWSDVMPDAAGVQSLDFDESTTLDYVRAFTNKSMTPSTYDLPHNTRAYYQPEELFSAYKQGIEINRDLEGFEYVPDRNAYVKKLDMILEPITYIYLTQVILHNNKGIVTGTDGNSNLSGMAHEVNVNTGVTGSDPATIHYYNRFKRGCDMNGESVDIAGGRLMTFGMTNLNPYHLPTRGASLIQQVMQRIEEADHSRHYLDVNLQFRNGKDSTYVWDVTDQVRRRFRGGVLTIEVDVDTLKIPIGHPGSGFDAVVKDWEEVAVPEIEM